MDKKQTPKKISSDDIVIETINDTLSPSHNMPTSVDDTFIEAEEVSKAITDECKEA